MSNQPTLRPYELDFETRAIIQSSKTGILRQDEEGRASFNFSTMLLSVNFVWTGN